LIKKNKLNFSNLKVILKIFYIFDLIINVYKIINICQNSKSKIIFVYSIYNLSPIIANFFLNKKIIWFLVEEPKFLIRLFFKLIPKKNIKYVTISNEIGKILEIKYYKIYLPEFKYGKNFKKKKNILISVGNLNRLKNHIFLINSLNQIKNKYKLYIIGGKLNTQNKYYKNLRTAKLKNDNIFLLGKKKRSTIKKYLSISRFFILPSLSEGFPLVLIEAINSGCVCLISKNSNFSKFIKNNYNGYIFDLNFLSFKSTFSKALNLNYEKTKLFNHRAKDTLKKLYKKNNLTRKFLLNEIF
jgi:glycosyltransferase involved in cell wall biosynthesis